MNPAGLRRAALLLGACALIAIGALTVVERLTRERIEEARAAAERAALAAVLPPARYNNDPLQDSVLVRAPQWLGRDTPVRIWRGRLGEAPSALAMETTAPEGYSGAIELLLGVDTAGTVIAARVTRHAETPGLGDPIERERSDWIEGFNGRGLADTPQQRWTVRREGGDFDSFSGATITPRAVARGLGRTLAFLQRHGEAIWAAEPGARLHFEDAPDAPD
ncbi:MAG: electron transport complex subunit RsxG [Xanthomonadales bacterium]|nr:electron transport complex subunit RsxG [Xanthomonadales bacterium]